MAKKSAKKTPARKAPAKKSKVGARPAKKAATTGAKKPAKPSPKSSKPSAGSLPPPDKRYGSIMHIEIPSPDLAKARAFYVNAIGWKIQPNVPMETYWFFNDNFGSGGGLTSHGVPSDHGICPFVTVANIDKTLAAIEKHGGKVTMPKTEIGGGFGFYAAFQDPSGNGLGLWSKA